MTSNRRIEQEETAHVQVAMEHLKERFPVVRIFVSRYEEETNFTLDCSLGHGNFFAQLGQVNRWIQEQDLSGAAGFLEE